MSVAGIGREPIFNLFKELLPKIRPPELYELNEAQLIECFMRAFTFPDEPFVMSTQFTAAVEMVREEQRILAKARSDRITQNKQTVLLRIQAEMEEENTALHKFDEEFQHMFKAYAEQEQARSFAWNTLCIDVVNAGEINPTPVSISSSS
jgi:hypothetical protein